MTTSLPLAGKTALVTGGSRGIGAAVVERLVRDGAKVVFTTSKSVTAADALVNKLGQDRVSYVVADSSDMASVRNAVSGTVQKHGGLDILVNNAGVFEVVDGQEDLYRRQNAVTVDFDGMRHVLSSRADRRHNQAINIRSRTRCCTGRTTNGFAIKYVGRVARVPSQSIQGGGHGRNLALEIGQC